MIDIFQGLGQHLLGRGFSTPFLTSPCTYMYPDLEAAKAGVVQLGHRIANMGLSPALAPMVFAFTGAGNVSQGGWVVGARRPRGLMTHSAGSRLTHSWLAGWLMRVAGAQEIFKLLPHEWVRPSDLPTLAERLRGDAQACRKLYGLVVGEEDLVERIEGGQGGFDRKEYRQHPDRYRAIFHERLAPYVSVLVNGVYWVRPHIVLPFHAGTKHSLGRTCLACAMTGRALPPPPDQDADAGAGAVGPQPAAGRVGHQLRR